MNRPYSARDHLPAALYCAADVRAMDQQVMHNEGISALQLMGRAAEAAFACLLQRWPEARSLMVLAGPGNNGGDAWLLAGLAQAHGLDVQLYSLGDPARASSEAQAARQQTLAAGVTAGAFNGELAADADVIVDGLLGTGLQGPAAADYARLIEAVNAHPAPVLALDLPSGLQADTGVAAGAAVRADLTVTFIGVKRGLLTADGPDLCGELAFAALTPLALAAPAAGERISWHRLQRSGQCLPARRGNVHKGDFGHALLVGGEQGFGGAILLAAEACARSGAGLVSVATRPQHITALLTRCPTVMAHAVNSGLELQPLVMCADVLALGPGLGQGSWGELLLQQALQADQPLVLDADALNLLASPAWRCDFAGRTVVLTPHPGEAARLLGSSIAAVQADRFAAALQLAQQYQAVVVLKGQGSIVAEPDGRLAVCSDGNPGMSSAGMGDVLTGIVAALLAQGMNAGAAARYAVCLHAAAADVWAGQHGRRGMLASDLAAVVQELVN
ncbi:NAD(P)H-hydrate dehydratase [Oceanospirillaceae bacterium ASx5O]|nr:NAD(P)H-hydrate dehydratase [Oceanospirillaceae bacterium ASx5O]